MANQSMGDSQSVDGQTSGPSAPPNYAPLYEPGDTPYRAYEVNGGVYGQMCANDYQWSNERCTAEAYGDHRDPSGILASERKRALMFHTGWMDVDEAQECLVPVGELYDGYEGFRAETVGELLHDAPGDVRVAIARECTPMIYVWTSQPVRLMEMFVELPGEPGAGAFRVGNGQKQHSDASADAASPPTTLGGFPHAETYPRAELGEAKSELSDGTPTLVQAGWE